MKIEILEKRLDYALIQNKINEPESRRDFEDFARRIRLYGTSVMTQLLHLVSARLSNLNLDGNHLKVTPA